MGYASPLYSLWRVCEPQTHVLSLHHWAGEGKYMPRVSGGARPSLGEQDPAWECRKERNWGSGMGLPGQVTTSHASRHY